LKWIFTLWRLDKPLWRTPAFQGRRQLCAYFRGRCEYPFWATQKIAKYHCQSPLVLPFPKGYIP
jgi:hypothetical protein